MERILGARTCMPLNETGPPTVPLRTRDGGPIRLEDGGIWTTVRARELRERLGIAEFDRATAGPETISA